MQQKRYLSYLLRLWQTSDDGEQVLRASLESPGTGERLGFASLEAVFEFLEAQMGRGTTRGDPSNSPGTQDREEGENMRSS